MDIEIVEKPDYISWDDIHNLLWSAHAANRLKGIKMKYPSLPGEEIQKRVEGHGKMFVALENEKLVGCAAVLFKNGSAWYCKGSYSYLCFVGVHPECVGKGIYKILYSYVEEEIRNLNINIIVFDTNVNNHRMIQMNQSHGFHKVSLKTWIDHKNIVMAKWISKMPFSTLYCRYQYLKACLKDRIKFRKNNEGNYVTRW